MSTSPGSIKTRPRPPAPPKPVRRSAPPPGNVTSLTERRGVSPAATERLRAERSSGSRGARLLGAAPPGRRSSAFVTLLGLVLVLNLLGLAMILSASAVTSLEETGSPWSQFFKQLQWFVIGVVALVLTMRRDYRRWRSRCGYGVIAVLVMLVLVVIPNVGTTVNGATRWLGYGPLTIQPSEFAKLALIVFWADLLARRAKWIEHPRLTVVPVLLTFGIVAALIMKQPNLGTTMVIFVIMMAMLFVAGSPLRWLGAVLGAGTAIGALFALMSPWRYQRLMRVNDPWADPQNTGYQIIQAQAAVADGHLIGVGLGQSRAKWNFLPEAETDFIFAVIAEETGLIGGLLVIALFVALAVTGVRVAVGAPDRFGMLVATGITSWFLIQAFLNIGQAVGRLPTVGVPLPFVSSGGSSLVVSMVAAGMLLNIARQTR